MNQKTQKAGAIVLSKDNKENVALLYRGSHKDWSFPKGHIEAGEDAAQAMIREIKEETGLSVKILMPLKDLSYTTGLGEMVSLNMFLAQSSDDSTLNKEFVDDKIQWVPFNDVAGTLSYQNLKEYFNDISDTIESHIASML